MPTSDISNLIWQSLRKLLTFLKVCFTNILVNRSLAGLY